MRIFITGASGFLGSQVVPRLDGHELLCLSRSPGKVFPAPYVRVVKGNLHDPKGWQEEVECFAPQWCIHLAWEGLPDYSLTSCRTNLDVSLGLLEVLVRIKIQRIVMAGSCWEYGAVLGAVSENHSAKDCGIFASAKRSLYMMLESAAKEYGFDYRWGRVFFSYGPGQRSTSLIAKCHAAYSNEKKPEIRSPQVAQDFIYVDDVAQGLIALTQADMASGVYNIGSGKPTTVGSVVNRVASHFDVVPPFSTQEIESGFWADTSKMTAATGWKAVTDIAVGIKQTLRVLDNK